MKKDSIRTERNGTVINDRIKTEKNGGVKNGRLRIRGLEE